MLQQLHAIAYNCSNCMQLPAIAAIACNCLQLQQLQQSHAAPIKKSYVYLQLFKFLKIHQKQDMGLKVCMKCFFTTTVNRFILFYFIEEEIRSGTHSTEQNVVLPESAGKGLIMAWK
jgi:hypothetical protein